MAHTFKISIENDLSSTLKEVENTIVENGGEFKGDTDKGEFVGKTILGKIKGKYVALSKDEVEITIIKKPFAVSGKKIKKTIQKYFA